jgi:hypothetical protein
MYERPHTVGVITWCYGNMGSCSAVWYDWDDEVQKVSISVLQVIDETIDTLSTASHMAMTTNLRDVYSSDCYCRTTEYS